MIRRTCALGAFLALCLQGTTGGHMLMVEHTRCAEHGELVHGVEAHRHATASLGTTATQALDRGPDATSGQAHEHCVLAFDRRDAVTHVARARVTPRSEETVRAPSFVDAFALVGGKRFRTAPKNSPPA